MHITQPVHVMCACSLHPAPEDAGDNPRNILKQISDVMLEHQIKSLWFGGCRGPGVQCFFATLSRLVSGESS